MKMLLFFPKTSAGKKILHRKSYNEMNIYCMHNLQGIIEIEELASIKNNIMSYGKSQTNYGLKDDALVGTYCLGEAECVLRWKIVHILELNTSVMILPPIGISRECIINHIYNMALN